jgi:hypothetical protein
MDPAQMLFTLRLARDLAHARRRRRWKAKVCTVMYREELMVARLEWFLDQLERSLKAERRRVAGD